jgi:hypothetical protein
MVTAGGHRSCMGRHPGQQGVSKEDVYPWKLADLANELGRALVKTDHRAFRIGLFCVEVEHILDAGDIF